MARKDCIYLGQRLTGRFIIAKNSFLKLHHDRPENSKSCIEGRKTRVIDSWLLKVKNDFLGLDTSMDFFKQPKFKNEKVSSLKKIITKKIHQDYTIFFG